MAELESSVTNFAEISEELALGQFNGVVGAMLSDLALAVSTYGRAGNLNIAIKVKPSNTSDNTIINFDIGLTIKEPKRNKGFKSEDTYLVDALYVGRNGKVTKERPKIGVDGQMTIASFEDAHKKQNS